MKVGVVHSLIGIEFRKIINTKHSGNSSIVGYIKTTYGIVEIGKSKSSKEGLYSVNIVEHDKHDPDLSKSFKSYRESLGYAKRFIFKEDLSSLKNLLERIL